MIRTVLIVYVDLPIQTYQPVSVEVFLADPNRRLGIQSLHELPDGYQDWDL